MVKIPEFEFVPPKDLPDGVTVQVKKMHNIYEVRSIGRLSKALLKFKRLSKNHYCDLETGELLYYKHAENRSQSMQALKRSFARIRDLINNNFKGGDSEAHIILTYAENMRDTKRLYHDFKNFWLRFKRSYGSDYDYITVIEPQGRGAWHHHLLIRNNLGNKIWFDLEALSRLWGHGFIFARNLKNVDNIGAYLSAYLTDLDVEDDDEIGQAVIKKTVDGKEKKIVKGGRLCYYPPGINLYRKSKGIIYPEVVDMLAKEIKKELAGVQARYKKRIVISKDDKILNFVQYESYNLVDKNKYIAKKIEE